MNALKTLLQNDLELGEYSDISLFHEHQDSDTVSISFLSTSMQGL